MAVGDPYIVRVPYFVERANGSLTFSFVETVDDPTGLPCKELAEAFESAYIANLAALLSTSTFLDAVQCYRRGGGLEQPYSIHLEAVAGTDAGGGANALPITDCLLLNVRTNAPPPTGQGRIYLSGLGRGRQANSVWDIAGLQPALGNFLTTMTTDLVGAAGGEWQLSVYVEATAQSWGISNAGADPIVRNQRRRITKKVGGSP